MGQDLKHSWWSRDVSTGEFTDMDMDTCVFSFLVSDLERRGNISALVTGRRLTTVTLMMTNLIHGKATIQKTSDMNIPFDPFVFRRLVNNLPKM